MIHSTDNLIFETLGRQINRCGHTRLQWMRFRNQTYTFIVSQITLPEKWANWGPICYKDIISIGILTMKLRCYHDSLIFMMEILYPERTIPIMMTSSNETFSALLAICAGNSPVPGEFPTQRPMTRSFDVFFDLHLNKRFSKQSWGWWLETLSWSLWRHCNVLKRDPEPQCPRRTPSYPRGRFAAYGPL